MISKAHHSGRVGRRRRVGRTLQRALLGGAAALSIHASAFAETGYRIFISADMEGISGAVTSQQMSADGSDYQYSRKIMTDEVLAAIEGARKAGATEFVVADSHGNGQNLLVDDFPANVKIIRGVSRPLQMMEGIQDGHFDAVMFVGYHAGASSVGGVRAHTFSSARISEIKVNGVSASEGYVNAAIASAFDVPVIMITGDDVAVSEFGRAVDGAELVAVKKAISFHAAEVAPAAVSRQLIREASRRATQNIRTAKPMVFDKNSPVTIDVTFHFYQPAELFSWLPFVERTGARSIWFQSDTIVEAMRIISFMSNYSISLEP